MKRERRSAKRGEEEQKKKKKKRKPRLVVDRNPKTLNGNFMSQIISFFSTSIFKQITR